MKRVMIKVEVLCDDEVPAQTVRARINEVFQTETEATRRGAIYWGATFVQVMEPKR